VLLTASRDRFFNPCNPKSRHCYKVAQESKKSYKSHFKTTKKKPQNVKTGRGGWVFGKQVGNPTSTTSHLKRRETKDTQGSALKDGEGRGGEGLGRGKSESNNYIPTSLGCS
jgi:hypothetical protein